MLHRHHLVADIQYQICRRHARGVRYMPLGKVHKVLGHHQLHLFIEASHVVR